MKLVVELKLRSEDGSDFRRIQELEASTVEETPTGVKLDEEEFNIGGDVIGISVYAIIGSSRWNLSKAVRPQGGRREWPLEDIAMVGIMGVAGLTLVAGSLLHLFG